MNLDEALRTIEVLKKENKRLQMEVDFLEKSVYNDIGMEDGYYDASNFNDEYDPRFD